MDTYIVELLLVSRRRGNVIITSARYSLHDQPRHAHPALSVYVYANLAHLNAETRTAAAYILGVATVMMQFRRHPLSHTFQGA